MVRPRDGAAKVLAGISIPAVMNLSIGFPGGEIAMTKKQKGLKNET
jgi:hypothetical protein